MALLRITAPDTTSRTLNLLDRHGAALTLLAQVLACDARQAETAVAAVLAAEGRSRRTLRGEPPRQDVRADEEFENSV